MHLTKDKLPFLLFSVQEDIFFNNNVHNCRTNLFFHICVHFSTTVCCVCCFRIPNLVNQRPPHLKFRGFPTLMASRFSKGADLIPHYPLLTFNLWPTHNLSPQNIGIQKDPKSWSLKICSRITSLCYNKVTQNMALCSSCTTLLETLAIFYKRFIKNPFI